MEFFKIRIDRKRSAIHSRSSCARCQLGEHEGLWCLIGLVLNTWVPRHLGSYRGSDHWILADMPSGKWKDRQSRRFFRNTPWQGNLRW